MSPEKIPGFILAMAVVATGACAGSVQQLPDGGVLFEVTNTGDRTLCGFYAWLPEHAGGSSMVAESPENRNWLEQGTYMVAEEHPKALAPGATRRFGIRVNTEGLYSVRARDCEEKIVFEEKEVDLAEVGEIEIP